MRRVLKITTPQNVTLSGYIFGKIMQNVTPSWGKTSDINYGMTSWYQTNEDSANLNFQSFTKFKK
ncbi:hypothetical protein TanjilG_23305 [Lupinus angustifolius]|uniref:Uncharacterized protein n=1 Tax=Lupinus angustifolius TaxID=3871 RepID=A0A1J7H062_LUPAN|nr:hypothetical protein TanjilG_23305 [Lupinus angustifolius]